MSKRESLQAEGPPCVPGATAPFGSVASRAVVRLNDRGHSWRCPCRLKVAGFPGFCCSPAASWQVFRVCVAVASKLAGFPSCRAFVQRFRDFAAGFPSCCRPVQGFSAFAGRLSEFPSQFACTRVRQVGKPAAGAPFPCTAIRKLGKPARRQGWRQWMYRPFFRTALQANGKASRRRVPPLFCLLFPFGMIAVIAVSIIPNGTKVGIHAKNIPKW